MRAHERRLERPLAEVLVSEYGDWSLEEIAADFGVSEKTIARWLSRLGIKRRLVLVHQRDGEALCAAAHPPDGGVTSDETPANEGAAA
jgi:hypothetical protein